MASQRDPEQAKPTPREQQAAKMAKKLSRLVYLERESPFPFSAVIAVDPETRVIRLSALQRALGVLEGTLLSLNTETQQGELEVAGHRFPCVDARYPWQRSKLPDFTPYMGQLTPFLFFPTWEDRPPNDPMGSEHTPLPTLKLWRVWHEPRPDPGYVEAIGKLVRVWPGGCEVTIWSTIRKRFFRAVFAGDYLYPDEVGQYVWVTGRFDPTAGILRFEDAAALAIVPEAEAAQLLQTMKASQGAGKNKRG